MQRELASRKRRLRDCSSLQPHRHDYVVPPPLAQGRLLSLIHIFIGGLEASLRRFAHYDYWSDRVRRSILVDSRADILSYGMGEKSILRIAQLLDKGVPVKKIRDVRGTAYLCKSGEEIHYPKVEETYDYDQLKADKAAYARAFAIQYKNNDAISGRAITEYYGDRMLVQNPPMPPLEREE